MKNFKGVYHDIKDTVKTYEFGAHFKYEELFDRLNKLKIEENKDNTFEENKRYQIQTENIIEPNEHVKKRKKYRLETFADKDNSKYLNFISKIKNEKNDDYKVSIIQEENNDFPKQKRKKIKLLTHSYDKVKLPYINTNNSNHDISLKNNLLKLNNKLTESNAEKNQNMNIKRNSLNISSDKFLALKNNRKHFPKINSLYLNNIVQQVTENNLSKEDENQNILREDENLKIKSKYIRKKERLKSIFEKEKQIKNNNYNLFLGEKNNYSSIKNIVNNDEMSYQIYNLKKKLLGNSIRITK